MLELRCPACGQKFGIPEDLDATSARCPRCTRAIEAPRSSESGGGASPADDDLGWGGADLIAPTRPANASPSKPGPRASSSGSTPGKPPVRAKAIPDRPVSSLPTRSAAGPPPIPVPPLDSEAAPPPCAVLTPVKRSRIRRFYKRLRRILDRTPLMWVLALGLAVIGIVVTVAVVVQQSKLDASRQVAAGDSQPIAREPDAPDDIPQKTSGRAGIGSAKQAPLKTDPPKMPGPPRLVPPPGSRPGRPQGPSAEMSLSGKGATSQMPSESQTDLTLGGGEQFTGTSRQYDNMQCMQIQAQHGIRVPRAAAILEVDGLRLRVSQPSRLAESPAPILFLPRGSHAVCFRSNEQPVQVTVQGDFVDAYEAMRKFFGIPEAVRSQEVFQRAAWTMDVHGAPFLLNFSGAQYAGAKKWKAAQRKFRRALTVNPMFVPAHLNLATCLLQEGARDEAAREVELADALNVGNVFGLADAIAKMRRQLGLPPESREPIDVGDLSYLARERPSEEDLRMVAFLEAVSKYAVRDEERAKILNNLAVHFADSDRPELALHYFHNALQVAQHAGEGRHQLARQIFAHMRGVCRKAGFDEEDEYRQMEVLVAR